MQSIHKTITCFLFLTLSLTAQAQYDFTKVDNWLQTHTEEMGGRSVLIIWKDGKTVYSKTQNDLSSKQKLVAKWAARRQNKSTEDAVEDYSPTSQVMIASCSKWLSAALVMQFVDDGKLKLTDTVGTYLPLLSQHGKGNITLWQCLSHLTGIKAPPLKESIGEMQDMNSMDDAIQNIADMPMEGKPGLTFHYSNIGLQIAGAVLEKISGKKFETLFQEQIASPLNMKSTTFGNKTVALPAGGARSTAEDYLRFLEMILQDGIYNNRRILSSASVASMQINYVRADAKIAYTPAEAGNWGYGFGEWVMDDAQYEHRSNAVTSPGLFGTFPWVDNNKHYCGILLTFYLKIEGRAERYKQLKSLVDEALKN